MERIKIYGIAFSLGFMLLGGIAGVVLGGFSGFLFAFGSLMLFIGHLHFKEPGSEDSVIVLKVVGVLLLFLGLLIPFFERIF